MADRLREAAEVIARQARLNAAGWSKRIPPSIRVSGSYPEVYIRSAAPPAYPNEIPDVWHPVFGGKGTKRPDAPRVLNQHRPFLAPAADEGANKALEKFSKLIDDWALKAGFR